MKLARIRIKDFRSFSGEHEFDVFGGVNYFVGPNNCGKSNLIRALELALDADARRRTALTGFEQARAAQKSLGAEVAKASGEDRQHLLARAKSLADEVKRMAAALTRKLHPDV